MNISEIVVSNNPVKLRYFAKETKSKILLDVKWSQLKGNKSPYLSVDVRQVKENNITIFDYQEKIQAISRLNSDFNILVNSHLCNTDGSGMHQHANMQYHFKLTQDQFGKEIYTSEKHNTRMNKLWDDLENHSLFTFLFKEFGHSRDNYFKDYLNKDSDKYLCSNATRSVKHWVDQIKTPNCIGLRNTKTYKEDLEDILKNFFQGIDQYRELTSAYKYNNLPSNREVWTPERLSEYYNLSLTEVMIILSSCMQDEKQTLIKGYSDSMTAKNKILIEELTNKYKIPLVHG